MFYIKIPTTISFRPYVLHFNKFLTSEQKKRRKRKRRHVQVVNKHDLIDETNFFEIFSSKCLQAGLSPTADETQIKFYRCYNFTPLGQCWSDGEQNNMIILLCCFTTFASLPRSVPFLPMFSHTHSTFRSLTTHNHKGVLKVVVPIIFYQEVRPKSPFYPRSSYIHSAFRPPNIHDHNKGVKVFYPCSSYIHSAFRPPNIHDHNKGVKVFYPCSSYIHSAFRPPNIHDHSKGVKVFYPRSSYIHSAFRPLNIHDHNKGVKVFYPRSSYNHSAFRPPNIHNHKGESWKW